MMAIRFTAQHSTSIDESACTRKIFNSVRKSVNYQTKFR